MQLIGSFIVVNVLVLMTVGFLSYSSILSMLQKESGDITTQNLNQAVYNIETFMNEIDRISKTILTEDILQSYLLHGMERDSEYYSDASDLLKTFSTVLTNYDYIDSIFVFTEGIQFIGSGIGRTWIQDDVNIPHQFYASELYQEAKSSFPKLVWAGGYTAGDFMQNTGQSAIEKKRLISVAKGIKSFYESKQSATLVINIDESRLRSIFGRMPGGTSGSMYIVDKNGFVISGSVETQIGVKSDDVPPLSNRSHSGSTVVMRGNMKTQLIYSNLMQNGWTLVRESPMQYISSSIEVLQKVILISFTLGLILVITLYTLLVLRITSPLNKLVKAMKDIGRGEVGIRISEVPKNEVGILLSHFNTMSDNIMELMENNKNVEKQKSRVEIEALQAQINPHFLYNTLNMIRWMAAVIKATNIVDSLIALSGILKPVFSKSDIMHTIREEMDYLANYIIIMKYRFGNSISFIVNADESLLEFKTLRFILQPIVENAVMHGFKQQKTSGVIKIDIFDRGENILFDVSDSGVGMEPEKMAELNRLLQNTRYEKQPNGNVGLSNVNTRIKIHFGEAYGIRISSGENMQTSVSILVPKVSIDA
jgi:sensor histidine kinase YesM